jgi:hypothetical protein
VCQFDTLRRCLTARDVFRELETLPKTLESTYELILNQIPDQYCDNAFKLLRWLAFSARSTTIHEAAEMLATNLDEEVFDPDLRLLNAQDVMHLCSSLVSKGPVIEVLETEKQEMMVLCDEEEFWFDQTRQSWIVQLAHFSVKDYIVASNTKFGKATFFTINPALSHLAMVETCLVYLLHPASACGYCSWDDRAQLFQTLPLYSYATYCLFHHLNRIGDTIPAKCWALLQRFFETRKLPDGVNFAAWICSLNADISLEQALASEPLYYACSFGCLPLVKKLCHLGADTEAPGGRFSATPLFAACFRRQTDVVRFLLDENIPAANVLTQNDKGETCLSLVDIYYENVDSPEVEDMLRKHGAR